MCDFKGGITNSGLWTFTMKPHGASFVMEGKEHYVWQILPTDVEFIPTGGFYVSDWLDGWLRPNKGRIYHFYNEQAVADPVVAQTASLLKEGFTKRTDAQLAALLLHADQRVRQEAQFELADRGDSSIPLLLAVAQHPMRKSEFDASRPDLARLHAIWALGQIARKNPSAVKPLIPLLSDPDLEVRASTAKILGESKTTEASDALIDLLKDEQPRVQFFAAMALGKLGNTKAVQPLFELLARSNDKDAYIRHSCVLALARLGDLDAVLNQSTNQSPAIRLGALETLRRWQNPKVAQFLNDQDPRLILEAARAINDVPIPESRPQLAALLANHKLDWKVLRRALNANFREGQPENAQAIANFAAAEDAPESVRIEALDSLNEWEKPSTRDESVVDDAVKPLLAKIVQTAPQDVRLAALNLALKTGLDPLDVAYDVMHDNSASPSVQSAALAVLAAHNSPRLADALQYGLLSKNAALRKQAIMLQTKLPDALPRLNAILDKASPADQQAVFDTLPQVGPEADGILANWLDKLIAKQVPAASTLDLLQAAERSKSKDVQSKLAQFNATRNTADNLGNFRECLEGGDPTLGKRIYAEKQEVACVRCHAIRGMGGSNVGPNLTDIGKRQTREYILESIVDPNAKIAPGFESANIKLNNGKFYTGIVKSETADQIVLDTGTDHGIVTITKSEIKKRTPALSPMPQDIAKPLSKRELRDLVEFLSERKG
jgi:quinoprotein glucose dehydrogenase